ncbi:Tn3 family transposase [Mesorhizobium sp. M0859]|uniref:Tn3 family transposase n=1 Tax=Mesorhizobium sp. M0859 TaxID=2957014 RepID=UPI0033399331
MVASRCAYARAGPGGGDQWRTSQRLRAPFRQPELNGPLIAYALTVYLSRAVDYVRGQGIDIPAELLSEVAPLLLAHIALTGDYLWKEIDRPLERFTPIRANRFNPNNFEFP